MSLAVSAGLPALLGQLSHPDPAVRRILAVVLAYTEALPDDIVPALRAHSEHDLDAPVTRRSGRKRVRGLAWWSWLAPYGGTGKAQAA
ncbi:hypothetical protein CP981_01410 [Streptomyces platensis]|uniref:HEAT repeat protein n=1 Tax=Streptomyces platensis TaxID=58346 RepID=A0AAE6TKC0_STRPT|nr:hypothetical protein [Streptomyces platensis]QEV50509.1 hypothetical protein CP981_01410 [Streptomyces platensis]